MPLAVEPPIRRNRQLRLLDVENPLAARLGPDFFRRLPATPGVYFFYDSGGLLLYIGQSNCLRARVGSYRHVMPERHARRTLRLVNRIARIEWQECATHSEAQELERVLLLEKRPPFNRAGVWPGYAWWLTVQSSEDCVAVRLSRHPVSSSDDIGPLPSAFRHVLGSLMRCTFRLLHPDRGFAQFPLGLLNFGIPLHLQLKTSRAHAIAPSLVAFATGGGAEYLSELQCILQDSPPLELEFWAAELETLQKYASRPVPSVSSALPFPAISGLPLFPDW